MGNWLSITLFCFLFSGTSYAEQLVTKERHQLFQKTEDNTEALEQEAGSTKSTCHSCYIEYRSIR